MVLINTSIKHGDGQLYESHLSDPGLIATTDTIEILDMSGALTHCFIGVQMFDGGGDLVLGTVNFDVTVKTLNTLQFEVPTLQVISAATPMTVSVAGNICAVRVVPDTVAGVVSFRVLVTCNRR